MYIEKIPEVLEAGSPATTQEIADAEKAIGLIFPKELKELLSEANGVTADLVQFYSCQVMPERNETYEVAKYAPGYILFASVDGCPVLVKSAEESEIYENGWGAMSLECMRLLASSLKEWVNLGCPDSENIE